MVNHLLKTNVGGGGGGGGGLGKPFVCMRGRNCIIDIICIICISCSGGDASKSPGYGDIFWLLLV